MIAPRRMIDKYFSRRAQRYIIITVNLLIFTWLIWRFGTEMVGEPALQAPDMATGSNLSTGVGPDTKMKKGSDEEGEYERENATFVTLCRDEDLDQAMCAVQNWEDRFNHRYHYNWVFLNDKEFSDEFKKNIKALASGPVQFGLVPPEMWDTPEHLDLNKIKEGMEKMKQAKVIYADNLPYRKMCRFFSGFFQDHELVKPFKYFWRVDPDTSLHCDIDYDVFKFMREKQKRYGFVITFHEFKVTVASLWKSVSNFVKQHPDYVNSNSGMNFVKFYDRDDYNMCHFWTNFEIGDLDFFRSQVYREYFRALDADGGFFYERWGDAPVHSIAVSLFMDKKDVHFFEDVGYKHGFYHRTPENHVERGLKCSRRPKDENVDWKPISCLNVANQVFELGLHDPGPRRK